MFQDWSASFNRDSEGAKAQFQGTQELVSGIGAFVQGCIDPRVSPEVRESYKHLLDQADEIWQKRYGWKKSRIEGSALRAYLYQAEMEDETVRYFAGLRSSGVDLVLMDEDGQEFVPCLKGDNHSGKIINADVYGIFPVRRVLSLVKLGR